MAKWSTGWKNRDGRIANANGTYDMGRRVRFESITPIKIDPTLKECDTPPAPNVIPWPRDEHGNPKRISICACGLSARFPFCDGAHKACQGEDPTKDYHYDPSTKERREVE